MNLGWTQQKCANYFYVRKASYQKWEWNKVIPDISKRKKVIEFLDFNFWNDKSNSLANKTLLYRIEHQLYRYELAKLIGISDRSIERLEKGELFVSIEIQETIKKFILKLI